jgi:hypothetical protein
MIIVLVRLVFTAIAAFIIDWRLHFQIQLTWGAYLGKYPVSYRLSPPYKWGLVVSYLLPLQFILSGGGPFLALWIVASAVAFSTYIAIACVLAVRDIDRGT